MLNWGYQIGDRRSAQLGNWGGAAAGVPWAAQLHVTTTLTHAVSGTKRSKIRLCACSVRLFLAGSGSEDVARTHLPQAGLGLLPRSGVPRCDCRDNKRWVGRLCNQGASNAVQSTGMLCSMHLERSGAPMCSRQAGRQAGWRQRFGPHLGSSPHLSCASGGTARPACHRTLGWPTHLQRAVVTGLVFRDRRQAGAAGCKAWHDVRASPGSQGHNNIGMLKFQPRRQLLPQWGASGR